MLPRQQTTKSYLCAYEIYQKSGGGAWGDGAGSEAGDESYCNLWAAEVVFQLIRAADAGLQLLSARCSPLAAWAIKIDCPRSRDCETHKINQVSLAISTQFAQQLRH